MSDLLSNSHDGNMQSFKAAADDLETSKLRLDEQGNEEALKFKTLSVEVQKLKEQKWDQRLSFVNGEGAKRFISRQKAEQTLKVLFLKFDNDVGTRAGELDDIRKEIKLENKKMSEFTKNVLEPQAIA